MKMTENLIHILKPGIFSFQECLHFLDRGYDDCLYSIENGRVLKALLIKDRRVLIEVADGTDGLQVTTLSEDPSADIVKAVENYVTDWFDLNRDLQPFYDLIEQHHSLNGMGKRYLGLRLMGIPDLFEALCWCVLGQQINLTFAHSLKRQLVETYGTFMTHDSKRYYFFPQAEVLAALSVEDLKGLQFSRQKAEYLIGIAKDFINENLSKQELVAYDNTPAMLNRLKKIRGVGDWTANYVLMKSLGRTNCITYGDTGLQSAVSNILGLDRKPNREEIDDFFKPFAGWESYMVVYLWRSLS